MGQTTERERPNSTLYPPSPEEGENRFDPNEPLSNRRKELIEWWRNAPEKVIDYPGGSAIDQNGNSYEYKEGSRLIIGDEEKGEAIEIMDTCEDPWAHATVDRAFEELGRRDRPIHVLERGFGMGRTATKAIENLAAHGGGTYTVIELNREDANYARRRWKIRQEGALRSRTSGIRGTRPEPPNIVIEILEGEAYEETAKLAEAERKFDIIISDTFPLTEDEQGMNDLQDLGVLKRCLQPNGVFTFFAYFPGSTDEIAYKQVATVTSHFKNYSVSREPVTPPPDYKYLQTATGPIRTLSVVVCKNPIL